MEFGILGPLRVVGPDGLVALKAPKHRALLAVLLLAHREDAVSPTRLVDAIWDEDPPATASKVLQVYVSQLRRALGTGHPIVTRPSGYAVELQPGQLDLERFETLLAQARASTDPSQASALLTEAIALFRGPPLADAPLFGPAATEAQRLDSLRVAALEERVEIELALGRHQAAVGELEALAAEHPYRERLHGQLMLALYRSGRQADALDAYRRVRTSLVEDLGLDPGRELRELESRILAQDPALDSTAAPVPRVPAATPPRAPIPAPATPLLGRDDDVRTALQLLAQPGVRLLTLTGPGGIGKSRLSLELARQAPDARFAALAAVDDPERVIPTLAQSLGAVETEGETPFDALAALLRSDPSLVVIDNFEQVLDAAADIARLLASCPELQLIVSSRAALRIAGEHELAIPPLSSPDAVELFISRARAVDPRAVLEGERDTIAEICDRLDRLPLAIELAAARTKVLAPAAILDRLGKRLDLLTTAKRDAPERQRTLRAAIGWSYDLLDEPAQQLFAGLGVFAGGFTLEAAEAACGSDVLDGLAALADQSLVTRQDGRFGMLETVREYALERLEDTDGARRAHARAFARLLAGAERGIQGPDAPQWLARLDAERDNVRAAIEHAVADGDVETALTLVAVQWRHWLERGALTEGRALAAQALRLPGGPDELRQRALNGAGALAGEQGDLDTARELLEEAVALGPTRWAARARGNLGNLALFARDYAGAVGHYEQALAFWREHGEGWGLSLMLENLALAHDALGEHDEAVALLREALPVSRSVGDPLQLSSTLRALARVSLNAGGDPQAALALLHESLAMVRDLDNRRGIAEVLETIAAVATPAHGARLLGAAEAVRAPIGAIRQPDEDAWVVRTTAQIQGFLDAEGFEREREAGRALDLHAAVEAGLEPRGPTAS